jgi:glycosyltransferase involved in cell wall biosynthesis
MKILQVISYLNPKFGGDVNVCINLSKGLVNLNHEVTIITTDYHFDPQFADTIQAEGVKVIPFHCMANFGRFLYSPSVKTWLEKNIMGFDIIHLHLYRSYQNVAIQTFAKKYRIPYILQAHGSVHPSFEKHYLKNMKKIYDFVWGDKIRRDAAKLIALTETEAEQYKLLGVPKNKICIIPNGINLYEFQNFPKNGEFKKKFKIPNDYKVILFIGRLNKTKGLDLLIDAFYDLNITTKGVRLIIAGPDDGYLSAILKKIQKLNLQDEIFVTGFISQEEKVQAFIDSDVFVTPSYSGFPVTFLEACACGLPIITTTHGDMLNWINNYVGIVVEYNHGTLRNAIIRILNESGIKVRFGKNGKDLVKKEFNWATITLSLEKEYSQSINDLAENL